MAADKEVQELIEAKVHQLCSVWKDRIDEDCKECRANVRTEMTALQLAQKTIEAERHVFLSKVDQIKEVLDKVCKLLEGNGHGSMETRLTLLEQKYDQACAERSALKHHIESKEDSSRTTLRQAWLQALPQLLTFGVMGLLFLIYLIFTHFGAVPGP